MPILVSFLEDQIDIAKKKEFAPEEPFFSSETISPETIGRLPKPEPVGIITKIGRFFKRLFR